MDKFFTLKDGRAIFIREVFVEDAERLHEFYLKVTSETEFLVTLPEEVLDVASERNLIRIYRSSHNRLYLVAFYSSQIIGALKLAGNRRKRMSHVAELSIAVKKDFWGLGVGSILMKEAINWAKSHEIKRIELTVLDNNKRAINLYNKFGFVEECRMKMATILSDGHHDLILMAKFL
ncbi:MAG: GNAT family N-acetyltransferase [Thermotogaceae bacterium]|nr:GNAT family N-acetyltransferase [Thermotogaceae bacterium]